MLVVHIGPHKTATTYIQQNLFSNRDALAARGWIYPLEGTDGLPAHHHIAHNAALYLGGTETPVLAELGQRARAEGKNIVLSAEGFCRWVPKRFQALAEILGQDRMELVYVVRDPFDILYSYWAEEVKQGYSKGFADRFIENFTQGPQSRLLNPMRDLAGHLATGLKVRAVPYNVVVADKTDIYQHLCDSVLGLTDLPVLDARPKNTAFPIELTEFLRLLTVLRAQGAPHIGSDLRHKFMAGTTEIERTDYGNLIKRYGKTARRVVTLEATDFVKRRLEAVVTKGLAGLWTLPIEGRTIYKEGEQSFVHYDGLGLWQTPEIRTALAEVHERL